MNLKSVTLLLLIVSFDSHPANAKSEEFIQKFKQASEEYAKKHQGYMVDTRSNSKRIDKQTEVGGRYTKIFYGNNTGFSQYVSDKTGEIDTFSAKNEKYVFYLSQNGKIKLTNIFTKTGNPKEYDKCNFPLSTSRPSHNNFRLAMLSEVVGTKDFQITDIESLNNLPNKYLKVSYTHNFPDKTFNRGYFVVDPDNYYTIQSFRREIHNPAELKDKAVTVAEVTNTYEYSDLLGIRVLIRSEVDERAQSPESDPASKYHMKQTYIYSYSKPDKNYNYLSAYGFPEPEDDSPIRTIRPAPWLLYVSGILVLLGLLFRIISKRQQKSA